MKQGIYEYTEVLFKGPCFICHDRTKKTTKKVAGTAIHICSEDCYKDYRKIIKKLEK